LVATRYLARDLLVLHATHSSAACHHQRAKPSHLVAPWLPHRLRCGSSSPLLLYLAPLCIALLSAELGRAFSLHQRNTFTHRMPARRTHATISRHPHHYQRRTYDPLARLTPRLLRHYIATTSISIPIHLPVQPACRGFSVAAVAAGLGSFGGGRAWRRLRAFAMWLLPGTTLPTGCWVAVLVLAQW
jgi:hypothetical protein